MYIKPTEEQVKGGMEDGWDREDAERGYAIFDYDMTGLLGIEAIGAVYLSTDEQEGYSDEACAREAERSGFCKIIPVDELPDPFTIHGDNVRWFGWIDTPENRENIKKWCEERR